MTTPSYARPVNDAGNDVPPADPGTAWQMALNWAGVAYGIARQYDGGPLVVNGPHAGKAQYEAGTLAACMALVSIADSLRRLADHFTIPGVTVEGEPDEGRR